MKNKLRISGLIICVATLAACQEALSISSIAKSSSINSIDTSSIVLESSSSDSSSSSPSVYHPIDLSPEVDVFSNEINFELNLSKITEQEAKDLVTNDMSQYPAEKSLNKRTSIVSKKEESHVTVNRSDSTYSVKDLITEKHTINKTDSDNKWSFRKSVENTKTVYFKEEPLLRHVVNENLYFIKDNFFYSVHAEKSYYEGMEDRGTFEAYYTKREFTEEELGYYFSIQLDGYTFFNRTQTFNRISRNIRTNFSLSSSFYEADNYNLLEQNTNYDYFSSGEKGSFGCIADDSCVYHGSDLKDYPSMEIKEIDTINYHQDYLLNISDYFNYEEDFLTTSTSKNTKGEIIRDEAKQNRKTITEECEIFYPDLSKFEEREYTIPQIK